MKNNNQVDIPLFFFFFIFSIVMFSLFSKLTSQNSVDHEPKKIETSQPKTDNKKNITLLIDYNKPIICSYQTKEASISASLEGSSLAGTFISEKTERKYIVQGDCLFSWTNNELKGMKKCGIGSYIPLGKQLLSSSLGSIESLIAMIPKTENTAGIDFKALFASCKNVNKMNKGLFAIPMNIKFK